MADVKSFISNRIPHGLQGLSGPVISLPRSVWRLDLRYLIDYSCFMHKSEQIAKKSAVNRAILRKCVTRSSAHNGVILRARILKIGRSENSSDFPH